MQALEKTISSNNWITIVLVVALVFVFLLKGLNSVRLKQLAIAFLNKNVIDEEVEERNSFFNGFNLVRFLFLTTVLSLSLYIVLINYTETIEKGIVTFGTVFLTTTIYFSIKWFLEYLIAVLFLFKDETRFYLISKSTYLYSITFALYVAVILFMYSGLSVTILGYFMIILFLVRFAFHVAQNKNLILSKLFYFILYLCAFEIAPLFVLFKLML